MPDPTPPLSSHAVGHCIYRLELQIAAAPSLDISEDIPGSGPPQEVWKGSVLDVILETANHAKDIVELKSIDGGRKRYVQHCLKAFQLAEPVGAILTECATVRNAMYPDGESREKALARLKDRPERMVKACRAAIAELQPALRLLEEGDSVGQKLAGNAK